jgi:hypothetical protein
MGIKIALRILNATHINWVGKTVLLHYPHNEITRWINSLEFTKKLPKIQGNGN